MWRVVGLVRSTTGLRRAQLEIDRLTRSNGPGAGEVGNLLMAARLITTASALRTESRGAHFRRDFPQPCRHWNQDLFFEGQRPLGPRPNPDDDRNRVDDLSDRVFDSWED